MRTVSKEELMRMEQFIKTLPTQAGGATLAAPQERLTFVVARATWFRQAAPEGGAVLWIASTDSGYVTRTVTDGFVRDWGPVIIGADQLWLGVDASSTIQLWQPGATF